MPLYVYKCVKCNHSIDVFHKMDEKPNLVCTKCGSQELEKQVATSSFQLKGTGWTPKHYKG